MSSNHARYLLVTSSGNSSLKLSRDLISLSSSGSEKSFVITETGIWLLCVYASWLSLRRFPKMVTTYFCSSSDSPGYKGSDNARLAYSSASG